MHDRWDEDVHYYDYTPDSMEQWPDRDASTVAKAFIYSDDCQHTLGIIIFVSGLELRTSQVSREQVIHDGAKLRDELVDQYKQEGRKLKENRVLLYSWEGHGIH